MALAGITSRSFSNFPMIGICDNHLKPIAVALSSILVVAMSYFQYRSCSTSSNLIQGWRQASEKEHTTWEPIFLPGICDQISDANWRSLPSRPDFWYFQIYFSDCIA